MSPVLRPRRRRPDEEERVLPLINVVFLLLIFFMVVGRISASDPFEIEPTRSESEGPAPGERQLVHVGADGRLALDGAILSEDALVARIADGGGRELRIKADARAEADAVVRLLDRLRAAGVERARLMTVPGPR